MKPILYFMMALKLVVNAVNPCQLSHEKEKNI